MFSWSIWAHVYVNQASKSAHGNPAKLINRRESKAKNALRPAPALVFGNLKLRNQPRQIKRPRRFHKNLILPSRRGRQRVNTRRRRRTKIDIAAEAMQMSVNNR